MKERPKPSSRVCVCVPMPSLPPLSFSLSSSFRAWLLCGGRVALVECEEVASDHSKICRFVVCIGGAYFARCLLPCCCCCCFIKRFGSIRILRARRDLFFLLGEHDRDCPGWNDISFREKSSSSRNSKDICQH